MLRALLAAIILAGLCPGALGQTEAATTPTVTIDGETTRTTQVPVGALVELKFRASYGSGVRWVLESQPEPLTFEGSHQQPLDENPPGFTGGVDLQIFSFRAARPGEAKLIFHYRRPWLKHEPPRQIRKVVIDVVP